MNDLSTRLRLLAESLRRIEKELEVIARQDAADCGATLPEALLDLELLTQVKTTLDNVRHLLWPYVEVASQRSQHGLDETLQRYRMERVTQMLEDLKARATHPAMAPMPEVHTFLQGLQAITDSAVKRHLKVGPESASAPEPQLSLRAG